ncbi:MAG: hypothetical protein R6V12_19080, partial [Candidatus Hydrogenedentota bacterium]
PDALVVAVANHIPASKPETPRIKPAHNVTVSVALPKYLPHVAAFEVTEDALRPVSCTIQDSTAFLDIEKIVSGKIFLLRRASS